MSSQAGVAALGRDPSTAQPRPGRRSSTHDDTVRRKAGSAEAAGDSMGTRALVVLVLTTALIFFMSRKDVGRAASRSRTAPHVFEQWPSDGVFSPNARVGSSGAVRPIGGFARRDFSNRRDAGLIYARAMFLAGRYDSRPYWRHSRLGVGSPTNRATADLAIEHLIPCESGGRNINRVDVNGKMSYGVLQFQDWKEWEAVSGIRGDPDNREDAIRMGEWAIENGMVNHWTCAQILKISD